jgi:hypothetical protein
VWCHVNLFAKLKMNFSRVPQTSSLIFFFCTHNGAASLHVCQKVYQSSVPGKTSIQRSLEFQFIVFLRVLNSR